MVSRSSTIRMIITASGSSISMILVKEKTATEIQREHTEQLNLYTLPSYSFACTSSAASNVFLGAANLSPFFHQMFSSTRVTAIARI